MLVKTTVKGLSYLNELARKTTFIASVKYHFRPFFCSGMSEKFIIFGQDLSLFHWPNVTLLSTVADLVVSMKALLPFPVPFSPLLRQLSRERECLIKLKYWTP